MNKLLESNDGVTIFSCCSKSDNCLINYAKRFLLKQNDIIFFPALALKFAFLTKGKTKTALVKKPFQVLFNNLYGVF